MSIDTKEKEFLQTPEWLELELDEYGLDVKEQPRKEEI